MPLFDKTQNYSACYSAVYVMLCGHIHFAWETMMVTTNQMEGVRHHDESACCNVQRKEGACLTYVQPDIARILRLRAP